MIGLILIQHGKGADAGASMSGGGAGTVFGSSGSGNFLSRSTAILTALFFITSISLAVLAKKQSDSQYSLSNHVATVPVQETPQPTQPTFADTTSTAPANQTETVAPTTTTENTTTDTPVVGEQPQATQTTPTAPTTSNPTSTEQTTENNSQLAEGTMIAGGAIAGGAVASALANKATENASSPNTPTPMTAPANTTTKTADVAPIKKETPEPAKAKEAEKPKANVDKAKVAVDKEKIKAKEPAKDVAKTDKAVNKDKASAEKPKPAVVKVKEPVTKPVNKNTDVVITEKPVLATQSSPQAPSVKTKGSLTPEGKATAPVSPKENMMPEKTATE